MTAEKNLNILFDNRTEAGCQITLIGPLAHNRAKGESNETG